MSPPTQNRRQGWDVRRSRISARTVNPIRTIVEDLKMEPNPDKSFIALSIGDPTVFRNLKTSEVVSDALIEAVKSQKYDGYANSAGLEEAREAVAKYSSTDGLVYTKENIILTHGCAGALDSCVTCLTNPGQNILIPKPGFPICRTFAESIGAQVKYYKLLPDKGWQVDLDDLEKQIDKNTMVIVVNNPSNPCGSVYTKDHLNDILQIARSHYLPIIADEIYEHMVFKEQSFIPLASLSQDVPILTCGGITKRHLIPGWRIGWVKVHDPMGLFQKEVYPGLLAINQRTLGCSAITQGALPKILSQVPEVFFKDVMNLIEHHSSLAYKLLSNTVGLKPTLPQGAMYMMVGIDFASFPCFVTEIQFIEQLVKEESLFCLPGACFNFPGYMRLVLTAPEEYIIEACHRITEFCSRHYQLPTEKNVAVYSIESKSKFIESNNYLHTKIIPVKTN